MADRTPSLADLGQLGFSRHVQLSGISYNLISIRVDLACRHVCDSLQKRGFLRVCYIWLAKLTESEPPYPTDEHPGTHTK